MIGQVVGEFALSQSYGFVAQEKDIGGTIQFIDDLQRYQRVVGRVLELRHVLRDNPIWQNTTRLLCPVQITPMTLGEMQMRKASGGLYLAPQRKNVLGQLLGTNANDPARFSELDAYYVACGAK